MCGIAGILGEEPTARSIEKMLDSLRHRGPDDSGVQVIPLADRRIILGSTRLAIVDLSSAGHMPMADPETGNWIVYNGEIYNFPEIRAELERTGQVFRSATDTEVALKAYAVWGPDCVGHFRGMFAFAIWDFRRSELFLARDRMGEKPLYFSEAPAQKIFLFASEIRALLASGRIDRRLDQTTLRCYVYNGFTIAPRTMIESVRSLLPGCWMRVGADGSIREIQRYWKLPVYTGREAALDAEELREVLGQSVRMRLLSDVPLGAFLSGGMDSSTITALMSRSSESVRTFSIGFRESVYDESRYARWVADKFHTRHTSILLGPQEFSAWLDSGLAGMDQPTFDGLNTYFVSRAARESGLTVALSGLGGDELFGGYPFFRSAPMIGKLGRCARRLPGSVNRSIADRLGAVKGFRKALHVLDTAIPAGFHLLAGYQSSLALFPEGEQGKFFSTHGSPDDFWFGLPKEFVEFMEEEGRDSDETSLLSRYILRLFEGERVLRDSDSLSMAVSLELRSVFTDHVLIEALWNVPGKVRCAGAPDKPYEDRMVKPILGEDYPNRKKQGFIFPFQEWINAGEIQTRVVDTLGNRDLGQSIGFNPAGLESLIRDRSRLPWSRIWLIYVVMDWAQRNSIRI